MTILLADLDETLRIGGFGSARFRPIRPNRPVKLSFPGGEGFDISKRFRSEGVWWAGLGCARPVSSGFGSAMSVCTTIFFDLNIQSKFKHPTSVGVGEFLVQLTWLQPE